MKHNVTVSFGAREQDPNADTDGAKRVNLKDLFCKEKPKITANAGESYKLRN